MSSKTEENPELVTYNGNCHCGRFKFHLKIPALKSVMECNCSICFKKGYKWIYPGAGFFIDSGEDMLKHYEFGRKMMSHAFCPFCGTGVLAQIHGAPKDQEFGINVKTLMDVDTFALDVDPHNGKLRDPQYQELEFSGELPMPDPALQNQKIYTGSCHCGAHTVAIAWPGPLPKGEPNWQDCDCSICMRNGTILIYPSKSQVSITNPEKLSQYSFGRKFQTHDFCATCGCAVRLNKLDIGEKRFKEHHPNAEYAKHLKSAPVNMRLLHGVEWDEIEVSKGNWSKVGEKYVCPNPE